MQSEPGKSAYLSFFAGTDLYVYLVSIHTSSPMKQNASTGSQPKSGKRNILSGKSPIRKINATDRRTA